MAASNNSPITNSKQTLAQENQDDQKQKEAFSTASTSTSNASPSSLKKAKKKPDISEPATLLALIKKYINLPVLDESYDLLLDTIKSDSSMDIFFKYTESIVNKFKDRIHETDYSKLNNELNYFLDRLDKRKSQLINVD